MATLWVREYSRVAFPPQRPGESYTPVQPAPLAQEPGTDQTPVTFTTSAASAAFASTTSYIAIIGSAAFHYTVADNPTATTSMLKVPADTLLFIGVRPGQKIAAVAAA